MPTKTTPNVTMPDPHQADGYEAFTGAIPRLDALKKELADVESELAATRRPDLQRQRVAEMAASVANGASSQIASVTLDNSAQLQQRIDVLREAVKICESEVEVLRRRWSQSAYEAALPAYRALTAQFAVAMTEAIRIARVLEMASSDMEIVTGRLLPDAGTHLLQANDPSGKLFYAARSWLELGAIKNAALDARGLPV